MTILFRIFMCFSLIHSGLASPPKNYPIELKTKKRTFNHVDDFALLDGQLWFRKRHEHLSQWQKIPFDQQGDAVPIEVKADGANLMVSDSNGVIHYKKVLKEWKDDQGHYLMKDMSGKDNWYSAWYSFPILELLRNPIAENRLMLPTGYVSWAISHRGIYNSYFEDRLNKKRVKFPMVTTVYVIPQGGKNILYADPYLRGGISYFIKGPDPDFIGTRIEASASMIFILGTLQGQKKMYTRLADFDTLGKNPILAGYWNENARGDDAWREVEFPYLERKADVSDVITILQNGEGNSARELRIEGHDSDGIYGYYYRPIFGKNWKFKALPLSFSL